MNFQNFHTKICQDVEQNLKNIFEQSQKKQPSPDPQLLAAMAYASLGGGKRIRALLVYISAVFSNLYLHAFDFALLKKLENRSKENQAEDQTEDQAEDQKIQKWLANILGQRLTQSAANALEMMHAYSLIHDDLPCMDDDDMRRGKPSTHKAFDEATALLAGDALQTQAFAELCQPLPLNLIYAQQKMLHIFSNACGIHGMCGGQSFDVQATAKSFQDFNLERLENIHRLKTGALIRASISLGFLSSCTQNIESIWQIANPDIPDMSPTLKLEAQELLDLLNELGEIIGLGFQVVDDILDATQDSQTLGKTAGKDEAQGKYTYIKALGLSEAQNYAKHLKQQADGLIENLFNKIKNIYELNCNVNNINSKNIFSEDVLFMQMLNTSHHFYQSIVEYIFNRKF